MADLSTYANVSDIILQSRKEVEEMLKAAGMGPLTNEPNQQQIDELSAKQLRQAMKDQKERNRL